MPRRAVLSEEQRAALLALPDDETILVQHWTLSHDDLAIRRYAELARLPPPRPELIELTHLLRRVAALETDMDVALQLGAPAEIMLDATQMEQALINLLRNAADAARETGGRVSLALTVRDGDVEITIQDEGPGLPRTETCSYLASPPSRAAPASAWCWRAKSSRRMVVG